VSAVQVPQGRIALLVALLLFACASPPPPEPAPELPPTLRPSAIQPPKSPPSLLFPAEGPEADWLLRSPAGDCFRNREARQHLYALQRAIFERWELPAGLEPDETVALRIRIAESGELLEAELLADAPTPLGASALDAVRGSAPFGPLSGDARCLSAMPLVGYFRNPARAALASPGAADRSETPPQHPLLFPEDSASRQARDCFRSREAREYLDAMRRAIDARWDLPAGLKPGRAVEMRIRVAESGELLEAALVGDPQDPLGAAALDAVRRSAPFGAMLEGARCLSGRPLEASFHDPPVAALP